MALCSVKESGAGGQEIATAVEFLREVQKMGHKEEVLRKYLQDRQDLSQTQIDEAFIIYHGHTKSIKVRSIIRQRNDYRATDSRPEIAAPGFSEESTAAERTRKNGNSERREKFTPTFYGSLAGPTFLLEDKQAIGWKHIRNFQNSEVNYCSALECLLEEYWKVLCDLADQKKISVTRTELNEIFCRIPGLLDFHKLFYQNLMNWVFNIGKMFVRNFNHFKEYVEYMKGCSYVITKMREHVHDRELHRILDQIRDQSKRKNAGMVDLLLLPLDRIMDLYKKFLDKLYLWGNKEQKSEYVFLEKAKRRIGRVANYIEKQKYEIKNKNEMNKIQQFISTQWNILAPNRQILRCGTMIRCNTTLPARSKHYVHYIFFLFTDVLLWTNRKGVLQNILRLRDCHVLNVYEKHNDEKKFKILAPGEHGIKEIILLKCSSQRERDKWFLAIKQQIKIAKSVYKITSGVKVVWDEIDWFSAKDMPTSACSGQKGENTSVLSRKKHARSIFTEDEHAFFWPRDRYQYSQDFPKYDSQDCDSIMEEGISSSESELEPTSYLDRKDKYGFGMTQLFPKKVSRERSNEEKTVDVRVVNRNGENFSRDSCGSAVSATYFSNGTKRTSPQEKWLEQNTVREGLASSNSSKVYRFGGLRGQHKPIFPEDTFKMLEQSSSFTVRLTSLV